MQKEHHKALAARDASQDKMQKQHKEAVAARDAAWTHAFQDPCLSICFLIQSVWCDVWSLLLGPGWGYLPAFQGQSGTRFEPQHPLAALYIHCAKNWGSG